MKRTLTLSLAAMAVLAGSAVEAQPARDADHTREHTRAQALTMADRMFERMDANSDGRLDQADREARQRARFDRMDADSDGAVSFAEMQQAREARASGAEGGERKRVRGERRPGGMGAMRHRASHGADRMARAADTDEDGAISRDEFRTAAVSRFDRADANSDGTVTSDERRALREQMRGERSGTVG